MIRKCMTYDQTLFSGKTQTKQDNIIVDITMLNLKTLEMILVGKLRKYRDRH